MDIKKNPAFNFKITQYITGVISFEKLKAWIESKPNKDELYEMLFVSSKIIISQFRQAGSKTAKFNRFIPLLEWFNEYAQAKNAENNAASHPEEEGEEVLASTDPATTTSEG